MPPRSLGRRLLGLVLVVGVGFATFGACSSTPGSSGPTAKTDAGGEAEAGPSGFASTTCGACFAQTCQKQVDACHGDPECASYLVCLQGCPADANGNAEASCVEQCPAPASSSGKDAVNAVESCRTYAAGTSCTECGAVGNDNPILHQQCTAPGNADACTTCYVGHCCDTADACNNNADCYAMVDCTDACDPSASWTDCLESCFKKLPNGAAAYSTDFACWDLFCEAACGFPSPYSAPCLQCLQGPCASATLACETDPECFLLDSCVGECGFTAQCVAQCAQGRSDLAFQHFEAKFVCVAQQCGDACDGD